MEFPSKVKFFFVSYMSIGRDGKFDMRAKYFYGMVRRRKCSVSVIAVLGEGISLEGQVCSKFDFSGNENSRRLGFTQDEREKKSWKILQIGNMLEA